MMFGMFIINIHPRAPPAQLIDKWLSLPSIYPVVSWSVCENGDPTWTKGACKVIITALPLVKKSTVIVFGGYSGRKASNGKIANALVSEYEVKQRINYELRLRTLAT